MPTSFKVECLKGTHNFTASTGDTFKCALYPSTATLDAAITAWDVGGAAQANECPATGGYTRGGAALTSVTPVASGTAGVCDFNDLTWSSSTITARGCLIYNSSKSNKSCSIHDFGSDKSSSNGNFTIVFPTADSSNAVIRLT